MTNPMSDSEILDWLDKHKVSWHRGRVMRPRLRVLDDTTDEAATYEADSLREAVQLAAGRP